MPVRLHVFVITVTLAHQVLASLFSVPLVAAGILFLTFQKSMTNNPVRMKIVSFSGESLHHFLFFVWQNVSNEVCLISWAFADLFSIFNFFSLVSLLCVLIVRCQIFVLGPLNPHQVQYNQGLYLKIFPLYSILFYIS